MTTCQATIVTSFHTWVYSIPFHLSHTYIQYCIISYFFFRKLSKNERWKHKRILHRIVSSSHLSLKSFPSCYLKFWPYHWHFHTTVHSPPRNISKNISCFKSSIEITVDTGYSTKQKTMSVAEVSAHLQDTVMQLCTAIECL